MVVSSTHVERRGRAGTQGRRCSCQVSHVICAHACPRVRNRVIAKPFESHDERVIPRLRAVLHPLMLRRTKDMTDTNGVAILELPPRIEHAIKLQLSPVEHDFYQVRQHTGNTRGMAYG